MSVDYRSTQTLLFARLQEHFGSRGVAFTGWTYQEVGGGTERVDWGTDWWAPYTKMPPGGYVSWYSRKCNSVGVFWIGRPGGGLFRLSATQGGGAITLPLLTLDGESTSPTGCYTNVTLPLDTYGLRADTITGTNVIVGARMVDTSGPGIATGFLTKDGQNLRTIFSLSTNVLYPILSAINPQLVVWHMKEYGDIGSVTLSNKLYELEAMWSNCVTNGDVVYIGTPYEWNDANAEYTPIQNRLIRQAAVRANRAYIDCMTPCVSYETMRHYGLMNDGVHLSDLGYAFLANAVVWPQLGLSRLVKGAALEYHRIPSAPRWLTNTSEAFPVYGWAVTTPDEGVLILKNPTSSAASISIDVRSAFDLSSQSPGTYDLYRCDPWSRVPVPVLEAGVATLLTLNSGEKTAIVAMPRITSLSLEHTGDNLIVRWPGGQGLQQADTVNGPWRVVGGAVCPLLIGPTSPKQFFRCSSQ
jgi:hypothetical protein